MPVIRKGRKIKERKPHADPVTSSPSFPLAWIGVGWSLAFFAILALLNFHPVVKTEWFTKTPLWIILPLFLGGLTAMAMGYRRLPTREKPDIGRTAAWIGLAVILAAGWFLRLYHAGQAPGQYWDDWATADMWVHVLLDKNKFFWMFPSDGIEPFVPYVIASLQAVVPDGTSDLLVRRISGGLVDMAALWILYLAGKELGSRRLGLFAAALGALGRPMIQLTVTGMRAYSLSLAVGFLILTTFKLLKKPSLTHFLLWGLGLAFGVHTYSSFRVFMLLVPFLLLPWAWEGFKKTPLLAYPAVLGSVLLLMGIYSGTIGATYSAFSIWYDEWKKWTGNPWFIPGLFVLCLILSAWTAWPQGRGKEASRLSGWSLSLGLSCFLVYPLTLSFQFNDRLSGLSAFHGITTLLSFGKFMGGQVWLTLKSLFFACQDRGDLQIAADPFYDVFSQGALVLGLAFWIARPDWKKTFLLVLGGLGTLVYLISVDPASTKLIASAPPLYLLAALALSRLWSVLPPLSASFKKFQLSPILLATFLCAYAAVEGWAQFEKIHGYWANIPGNDEELARHIAMDEGHFRVYLAPSDYFFGWNAQLILNEGKRYYILKDSNTIPVEPGKTPEDVVVFIYGDNASFFNRLCRLFPPAQTEKIFIAPHEGQDSNPDFYMWRVMIPGSSIPSDPKAILHWKYENGPWLRRYFTSQYGWRGPGIEKEERMPHFSDPLPLALLNTATLPNQTKARLAEFLGDINVEKTGHYQCFIHFPDPLWIRIDGKTVWKKDVATSESRFNFDLYLNQGIHYLEIRTRFPSGFQVPDIYLKLMGGQTLIKL